MPLMSTLGTTAYARVTGSDSTTTGQVLVDITGLTLPLLANAVYEFSARMSVTTSADTTGVKYAVQYSAAGATVEAGCHGTKTNTSAYNGDRVSALNTATASTYLTTSAVDGTITITGVITVGANAGNLTIQHLKVTSGTSTVRIGSFLRATRIG